MKRRAKNNKITIGTRGSKLALWQAEFIKSELQKLRPDLEIEINKIKTTGDKILNVPLAQVGGKGLFVKEIEEALLEHRADIAVHSMKDVPTEFPAGLQLSAVCKREDPRDVFISQIQNFGLSGSSGAGKFKIQNFKGLPEGARIGTSSLRRSCQLLNIRPDLKIKQLRGNLDTRLRKLDEGQFDAIILAAAGVKRLGWQNRITQVLPFEISLPAIGQGAIGIECRTNDEVIHSLIASLNHFETSICVKAERAFLRKLEGGCQVPIAAHARIIRQALYPLNSTSVKDARSLKKGNRAHARSEVLVMDGLVGSISGDKIIKGHIEGSPKEAEPMGIMLAEDILSRGAGEILAEVYKKNVQAINSEIGS